MINYMRPLFLASAYVDGKTYFADRKSNGIYWFDDDTKDINLVYVFDGFLNDAKLYEFAIPIKSEIWFIPYNHIDSIVILDTKKESVSTLDIPKSKMKCMGRSFMGHTMNEKKMYLYPANYDAVLEVNIEDRSFDRYELNLPKELYEEEKSVFISGDIHNDLIYMAPWNYNRISVFDIKNNNVEFLPLKIESEKYRIMLCEKDYIYLFSNDLKSGIDVVTYDGRKYRSLKPFSESYCCRTVFKDESRFIFVPIDQKRVYIYDETKEELYEDCILGDVLSNSSPQYTEARNIGEKVYVQTENIDYPFLIYNYVTHTFETRNLIYPKDQFLKTILKACEQKEKSKEK